MLKRKPYAVKGGQIQEVDDEEVEYEIPNSSSFFSTHANLIPLQSAVQAPRLFYGARFYNQALPLRNAEAPLVQNLDPSDAEGRSFDQILGRNAGAFYAEDDDEGSEVLEAAEDHITLRTPNGEEKVHSLYHNFPFNRKSISGSSRVAIRNKGQIRRIKIEDYVPLQGDEIQSYDVVTKRSSWELITGYIKHENDKTLFEVSYQSGRKVTVTADHSLLTLDHNWEITPVYPEDCVVNMTKSPLVFGDSSYANIPNEYEEGALVGLYIAEGHLPVTGNLISIAVEPPGRVAEVRALVKHLFPAVKTHKGPTNCGFTSKEYHTWLRKNCGVGSGSKFISDAILNRSREFLEGLISGYFAGDGCLWADSNGAIQVTAVTTSEQLRNDLIFVLQHLGVLATAWNAPRMHINSNWNDAYGLRVISPHLSKLKSWFFYSDRQEKFEKLLNNKKFRASAYEHVPCTTKIQRKNLYDSYPGKVPHMIHKSATGVCAVSKRRLTRCSSNVGLWANSDILWDKIVSIKEAPHEKFVYDFSINRSQAFAVNEGLLVHNTASTQTPVVKPGDILGKKQLLARSNFTDDKGTLAMGLNARVGLVPYKGHSFEDAVVISESFAKRMESDHSYTVGQSYEHSIKGGKEHYTSLFPTTYSKEQLKSLDDDGVVKVGTTVQSGDPLVLATRPRVFSSTTSKLGSLSKAMRQSRHDAAKLWEDDHPGIVTDVAKTKKGVKVQVSSTAPTHVGDKVVFRSGQKGVVSTIIPDDHMPRTLDGAPLEVLLNPLGIPSRANNSMIYELLLGKIAAKKGEPYRMSGFNSPEEQWHEMVQKALDENGMSDTEEVFDPVLNKKLGQPVTVGMGYMLKLHHTSASKSSARGQGGYDANQQPLKGSSESAQCFPAGTTVNTSDGPLNIGRICEKRLRRHVLSWHEQSQEWVYRPIVDWFTRRAHVSELITVYFCGPCDRRSGTADFHKIYNHAAISGTKGHEVHTPAGKQQLGYLKVGDEILVKGPVMTNDQRQMLIGTMLGDGHTHKDGDTIRLEHSWGQKAFMLWKHSIISGLGADWADSYKHVDARTGITHKSCATSLHLPYVTHWAREFFYSTGQKTVTPEWVSQIDELAFSVWALDDGSFYWSPSKGKYCLEIATCSFSAPETDLLIAHVASKFDIKFTRNIRGSLVASSKDAWLKAATIISKYIPWDVIPKSKAALVKFCQAAQQVRQVQVLDIQNKLGRIPVRIRDIAPYKHDKPGIEEINVYDFTVEETHNYCVSGINVSNSKRLSGLEVHSMLSAGAYNNIREGATLRGSRMMSTGVLCVQDKHLNLLASLLCGISSKHYFQVQACMHAM